MIKPAVEDSKKYEKNTQLEHAIKNNALNMKNLLVKLPKISKEIENNKIGIYAAYYNLNTCVVEFLKDKN